MSELTIDELHDLALKWAEHEEQARAHLARMNAPNWTVPYKLRPSYDSYGHGAALLGIAGRRVPDRLGWDEHTWTAAMRLAMEVGRAALGRPSSWADGYVGTPLLAAHMIARGCVTYLREDLGYGGFPIVDDLQAYIQTLWPTPATASRPYAVSIALRVHRQAGELGLYPQVPVLEKLVEAGLNTGASRYAVSIGHLLWRAAQDRSHRFQDLYGQALADLIALATLTGDER
ncbi:hypothetical protein [Planomonospora parontospora]|uniref:hypothetical protein n=1 Tax=Planomonospora parontospora TaxID=58119 RepID=UPI00166FD36E|nr:hypothetical protein [Planomonospora parontospora]GGL48417.1 hypothetical protein GCM10014719_57120 [Planomonospora parontospora subsp. antibiotica]GII18745.1 hypothetical protein Ppa05_54710 [Planomonospora parontospora subsp. antibiotica]